MQILAIGLGLACGALTGWLWTTLAARWASNEFWPQLNQVMKLLVSGDPDEQFLAQYLRLLPVFAKHVVKNLAIAALAFAPTIVVVVACTPLANRTWYQRATHLEVTPPQALTVRFADRTLRLREPNDQIPLSPALDASVRLSSRGGEFHCGTMMQKQAYSPFGLQRWLLPMLGFTMLEPLPGLPSSPLRPLMLQPSAGDANPLWPYLNDWEFGFVAALSLASIGSVAIAKGRQR